MATNITDTDSEDELPAGWEERVTTSGKVYYAKELDELTSRHKSLSSHNLRATQWTHPITNKKKKVAGELPFGWERKVNDTGHYYYVDHINKKTTYTDPRLAFAVEEKETPRDIKQRFDGSSTAQQVLMGRDLTGRYVIVTGGNGGIGYEVVRSLALHGAHIVMAVRNVKRANSSIRAIKRERPHVKIVAMMCDLSSLNSVAQFAKNYLSKDWPLHILILNAGVFSMPYTTTEDGFEYTFQVNHLGHFYLTRLLTELLVKSSPSRVVSLTSESHRFSDLNYKTISSEKLSPAADDYRAILAYNQSKLCNVLFINQLQRHVGNLGVTCNAVHPGNLVSTGITRNWWFWRLLFTVVRPFTKSKQQAAATVVYCAVAREVEGVGGSYFNNCFRCSPADEALIPKTAERLWVLSEQLIEDSIQRGRGLSQYSNCSEGAVHRGSSSILDL